jgi:hypothetical protein
MRRKEGMKVMRNDRVVSDGNGGSDTQAIAVSVTDQNDSGTATSLRQSISVAEPITRSKAAFIGSDDRPV